MQPQELNNLFEQYLSETISESDQQRLWQTLNYPEFETQWQEFINKLYLRKDLHQLSSSNDIDTALARTRQRMLDENLIQAISLVSRPPSIIRYWPRYVAAAAAVLLVICAGYFWIFSNREIRNNNLVSVQLQQDVAAPTDGAILQLADGSTINLDSASTGTILTQGGSDVIMQNGRLQYRPSENLQATPVWNTVFTPRARLFAITLPDGTQVWLNAGSSIRYPTFFTGKERKVEIEGEVFFDVAKNASMPFRVSHKNFHIDVLGTQFNINAYDDRQYITTSLLEGAISFSADVKDGGKLQPYQMKPGDKARFQAVSGHLQVIPDADIMESVAWKNGRFSLNGPFREIMSDIARWYDVDLQYSGSMPDKYLEGSVPRNTPLSQILKVISSVAKVQFETDGKKLIIK